MNASMVMLFNEFSGKVLKVSKLYTNVINV
jgi:hypothetical protein